MTKSRLSFFVAIGLFIAAAWSPAGALTLAEPVLHADRSVGLQVIDGGSWKKKRSFRFKKHYQGGHAYSRFNDHTFRRHKKKNRRAYRYGYQHGYDHGYDDGRRDRRYFGGYGRKFGLSRGFRSRSFQRHIHRYGSGQVRAPGFYFRF